MTAKREICTGCLRPARVCLCSAMRHYDLPTKVVIWQQTDEAKHPLSTAPLLHQSLSNSRLLVGDVFSPEAVLGVGETDLATRHDVALLYPLSHKPPIALNEARRIETLLILDGTWRKVRKLLHLNPWLNALAHIQLSPDQPSRYRVRKSPRHDGLSTLEAAFFALQHINPNQNLSEATCVLDRMADLQARFQIEIN